MFFKKNYQGAPYHWSMDLIAKEILKKEINYSNRDFNYGSKVFKIKDPVYGIFEIHSRNKIISFKLNIEEEDVLACPSNDLCRQIYKKLIKSEKENKEKELDKKLSQFDVGPFLMEEGHFIAGKYFYVSLTFVTGLAIWFFIFQMFFR